MLSSLIVGSSRALTDAPELVICRYARSPMVDVGSNGEESGVILLPKS